MQLRTSRSRPSMEKENKSQQDPATCSYDCIALLNTTICNADVQRPRPPCESFAQVVEHQEWTDRKKTHFSSSLAVIFCWSLVHELDGCVNMTCLDLYSPGKTVIQVVTPYTSKILQSYLLTRCFRVVMGVQTSSKEVFWMSTWRIIPVSKWLGSPPFISHETAIYN